MMVCSRGNLALSVENETGVARCGACASVLEAVLPNAREAAVSDTAVAASRIPLKRHWLLFCIGD